MVLMRSSAANRQYISKLEALAVYSQSSGGSVPLRQVVDIEVVWEPETILRRDRLKTITIGAKIDASITASEAFAQLEPWLDQEKSAWPAFYWIYDLAWYYFFGRR